MAKNLRECLEFLPPVGDLNRRFAFHPPDKCGRFHAPELF